VEIIFTNAQFYLFVVLAIFAIGDYCGIISKAKVSSVFIAMLLFLIGFMSGILPEDIIERAGLSSFASISASLLIFHMGTMINMKQLINEWKTVVTAILSMIVVMIVCFILIPFIGYDNAIVAIPVLNGGLISTQIMTEAAQEANLVIPAAVAVVIYAIKKFAGAYPASFFGVKEANKILADYRAKKISATKVENTEKKDEKILISNKFQTDFICICVAGLFAWISVSLGELTPLNHSIWALLSGALLSYFKIVPARILEKGKASGLLSMLVYATIIPSLAKISMDDLLTVGITCLILIVASLIGLITCFYVLPGWKLVKSKNIAVGISMGQLLGFPATYLISHEIAKAVTDDPEEQNIVLEHIMPAYVVAGMTTVTTLSIVVAGIFVNFL